MGKTPEIKPRLSVLVCTYGTDGIARAAAACYPRVEGVEYCISWQLPEGDAEVPEALDRPDIRVETIRSRGLSANRNHSLLMARGELSLIADDDVRYTPRYFENLFEAFDKWPEADIITFKYDSADYPKAFPNHSFDHNEAPKGYFVTSFEIAFRTASVAGILTFDERFGIGGRWPAGEEDVFMASARREGLRLRFVPLPVARHDGSTTSDREKETPEFIETKGASLRLVHPYSWPLRMIAHLSIRPDSMSVLRFLHLWLKGAIAAGR